MFTFRKLTQSAFVLAALLTACNGNGTPSVIQNAPAQSDSSISAQALTAIPMVVGQTRSLLPELNATMKAATDRVWSTNNGGVATSNQDGLVQAWWPGTAIIKVARRSSLSTLQSFKVTVTQPIAPAPVPAPVPAPTPAPAPTIGTPTLLRDYQTMITVQVLGQNFQQADYTEMEYRPRQFAAGLRVDLHNTGAAAAVVADAGTYAGWDALVTPNDPSNSIGVQNDWLKLHLNRASTLAVVWRSQYARPAWMQDWTANGSVGLTVNGSVQTAPVFTKTFPAGEVNLGRVEAPAPNGANVYVVLMAEANGAPSATPATPAGQLTPVPNTPCPAWVHDAYTAQGPDGKTYPTWHPQIDPQYWCSFGHEHGSDPAALGGTFKPLYGYTAAADGMIEPHVGFKSYTLKNAASGRVWIMTQHFGTAGQGRACARYHTLDVAVQEGGVVKADLHLMGDFGRGEVFSGFGTGAASGNVILPITGCPIDQSTVSDRGVRVMNTSAEGGYEPWVVDNEYNVTGFAPGFMSFKTRDPATRCADQACATVLLNPGAFGARRILDYADLWIKAGAQTGTFYTNTMADAFVAAGSAGSLQQYVEAGFSDVMAKPADPGGFCGTFDTWRSVYECDKPIITPMVNLENGLTQKN